MGVKMEGNRMKQKKRTTLRIYAQSSILNPLP